MRNRIASSPLELDRECLAIARYLTGHSPTGYLLEKYRDAHARHPPLHGHESADRFLLMLARSSAAGMWLVDCYTAVFFKTAAVRRKSVLVVALLESSAPTAEYFDAPDRAAVRSLMARLVLRGALFGAGLLASVVLLAPLHALLRARSRWPG